MPNLALSQIVQDVRADLVDCVDPATQESGKRFFKEDVLAYGVKVPVVNSIAKRHLAQIKAAGLDKADVYALCTELWASGYLEEGFVACAFSESQRTLYEAADFEVFEGWVHQYVTNWATCDTLCNHTVGDLLMTFPQLGERLMGWTGSANRWVRRAAAVSLIVPARKGLFHPLVVGIADALLTDTDDLVRKGYGWMLKAAADHDQQMVFDYVMAHKDSMPRTSLRYAIEKMPPELRQQAMA
ncbi:MAG: DNA alkylation repair protein [Micrococcales bacterium]|nr:DNA alkylation repair protein [Micrococcales bacterium]